MQHWDASSDVRMHKTFAGSPPKVKQLPMPVNQNVLHSQPVAISPGRATDIRGKGFTQLAAFKILFEDNVLTEEEFLEQKQAILLGLKKL